MHTRANYKGDSGPTVEREEEGRVQRPSEEAVRSAAAALSKGLYKKHEVV